MYSKNKPITLPQSVSNFWLNFAVIVFYSLIFWGVNSFSGLDIFYRFSIFAVSIAVTIHLGEKYLLKRPQPERTGKRSVSRSFYRYLGMLITFGFITFTYWLFPEYRTDYYAKVFDFFKSIALFCILFGFPYFYYLDSTENDGYLILGKFVLFKKPKLDKQILSEHAKKWIIKGFFLPLMLIYFVDHQKSVQTLNYEELFSFESKWIWYHFFFKASYYLDVAFAAIGYLMTLKIFNAEIKTSEPTFLGWFVALFCYSPFWSLFNRSYLQYAGNFKFFDFLSGIPCLIFAVAIIFCVVIYGLSTVALGIRFSNLTYRGLVSDGPYRFTKHPAYVAKNLSWWLLYVPFIPVISWHEALRCSILLFLLNIIYYLRAKTEENHLSKYPEYVEYALAMNKKSLFRPISDLLPFLKYKAPKGYVRHH